MTCHGKPIKVQGEIRNMTFEEVHKQYEGLLHNRTNKYIAHTLYDDIFQEAQIALWRAYKRYNKPNNEFMTFAYSWIWGAISTFLRDYNKTHVRNRAIDVVMSIDKSINKEDDIYLKDIIKDDYDLQKEILKKSEINDILSQVTDRQRKILIMIARGYSQSEISKLLGITRQGVNEHLRRVRSKFRKGVQHV